MIGKSSQTNQLGSLFGHPIRHKGFPTSPTNCLVLFFGCSQSGSESHIPKGRGSPSAKAKQDRAGQIVHADPVTVKPLARPGHDGPQDMVDARGIPLTIFPEPIVNVAIQAGSDQHLGRPAELRQLLVGQRRDIRIVDAGIIAGGLAFPDAGQHCPLPPIQWLAENGSDVDVMVVGEPAFGEVVAALGGAQETLSREINPTVYSPVESRSKLKSGHHFLTAVIGGERLLLIGDEHELARLGARRLGKPA